MPKSKTVTPSLADILAAVQSAATQTQATLASFDVRLSKLEQGGASKVADAPKGKTKAPAKAPEAKPKATHTEREIYGVTHGKRGEIWAWIYTPSDTEHPRQCVKVEENHPQHATFLAKVPARQTKTPAFNGQILK